MNNFSEFLINIDAKFFICQNFSNLLSLVFQTDYKDTFNFPKLLFCLFVFLDNILNFHLKTTL